jgi:hypothetical protein
MKKTIGLLTVFFLGAMCYAQQEAVITPFNKTYKIGERGPAGGWVFYDKGVFSEGWRYLEAAPSETEFKAEWGAYEKAVPGTVSAVGTGKRNTQIIREFCRKIGEPDRAAELCDALSVGGYDDWFLPGRDELNLIYTNLHKSGLGEFVNPWYWSSSQYDADYSWALYFSSGSQGLNYKYHTYSVRAVRAF